MTTTPSSPSAELLPCPFCGPGESVVECYYDDSAFRYRVGCGRCGASSGIHPRDKTRAPAIAAWNRRTPPASAQVTDALRECMMAINNGVHSRMRRAADDAFAILAAQPPSPQSGYVGAFYEIASMLGIPAMSESPKHVFETIIKPRLETMLKMEAAWKLGVLNVIDDKPPQSHARLMAAVKTAQGKITDALGFPLKVRLVFADSSRHVTSQDAETGLVTRDAEHLIEIDKGLTNGDLAHDAAHEVFHLFYSIRHLIVVDEETQAEVFGQLVRHIYTAALESTQPADAADRREG